MDPKGKFRISMTYDVSGEKISQRGNIRFILQGLIRIIMPEHKVFTEKINHVNFKYIIICGVWSVELFQPQMGQFN